MPMMDLLRAVQLRRLVAWLARGGSTGSVEGSAWLAPQFLQDADGSRKPARVEGKEIRLESPLYQWDLVVVWA